MLAVMPVKSGLRSYGCLPDAALCVACGQGRGLPACKQEKKSAKVQAYLDKKAKGLKAYLHRTGQLPEEQEKQSSLKDEPKK